MNISRNNIKLCFCLCLSIIASRLVFVKALNLQKQNTLLLNNTNKINSRSPSNYHLSTRLLFSPTNDESGCYDPSLVHLSAPELIEKNGFPFELHTVQTNDGYILSLHRIPAQGRPIILGFHGMFQSSRDFLMNCGRKAFAYKMHDAGYDVWLANVRGNPYSRCHISLNADSDRAYWNFTVDDIIRYDAPAIIDYILMVTGQRNLNWVGYSLGTAVVLGLGSVHPSYSQKLNLMVLLGTVAYVGNTKSPLMRLLSPLAEIQDLAMTNFNHGESLPLFLFPIMRTFLPLICSIEAKLNTLGFCSYFLFIVAGVNQDQSNPTNLPLMLGGTPGSLAIKMLSQWYQWINCGKFSYYDYGDKEKNIQKYGTTIPPNYDLHQVSARVINIWANNDWLSVPEDVQKTVSELPNVVLNYRVEMSSWNHLDFIYGKDADRFVYEPMIAAIKKLLIIIVRKCSKKPNKVFHVFYYYLTQRP